MENYNSIFESENIYYIQVSHFLIDEYLKMYNNPDIQQVLFERKRNFTDKQILNWIENCIDENRIIFSMLEKETNKYIGNIEIIPAEDNIGEVIISVTTDMQNKNYGTEAMRAIVKYGYEEVRLSGIELNVYKWNQRAIHCYRKVGFEFTGDGYTEKEFHMKYKKY